MRCVLHEEKGGTVLGRDDSCRLVRIQAGDHPGLCRVVSDRHARLLAGPNADLNFP